MRVKAIDIARELDVSKATVSLALNNKPGVNEKTKKMILECKARLESRDVNDKIFPKKDSGYVIRIIVATRGLGIIQNAELDLWTDVNAVFDTIAKEWGCTLEVSYFNMLKDSKEKMVNDCNQDYVAGVMLFGTEMYPSDAEMFRKIHKPKVVYDCDLMDDAYPCVVVNNEDGVRRAVDYLVEHQKKNIVYLARNRKIYNYEHRRIGFVNAMREYNLLLDEKTQLLTMGETIEEIYQNMKKYIELNKLPDAFIFESYHLSIGAIRAFRSENVKVPEDISVIGIDELPDYLTGEYQLTTIRIPHTERAKLAMQLLYHEMHDSCSTKSKLFTNCKLIEGDTV